MEPAAGQFEMMWALHQAALESVQLWVAERGGKMLCGQLYLVHGHHIAIFDRRAGEEALDVCAPTFLDYTMIQHFSDSGRWWYDMGESGGNESARAYKLRFCSQELDTSVHLHFIPAFQITKRLIHRLRFGAKSTAARAD
ncbi:MAG TPA: hypothetical protein VGA56_26420 [Opitutaceae bacterium]